MMKGYTDRVLLLLPKYRSFLLLSETEQLLVKQSVACAIDMIKDTWGCKPDVLVTDQYYINVGVEDVNVISPVAQEDLFFLTRNIECMKNVKVQEVGMISSEILKDSREKYKVTGVMNTEDRFELILKRDKYNMKRHIAEQKVVFSFDNPNQQEYNVQDNLKVDRIVIQVNPNNLTATTTYCGDKFDLSVLLDNNKYILNVYSW